MAPLALLSAKLLHTQQRPRPGGPPDATALTPGAPTRVDVAVVDHDRILTAAARFLTQLPAPLTSFPASHSPGSPNDFFSEIPGRKSAATA